MSTTLKKIADHAGVDVSVVSRVLNDKAQKYRISLQCQERIKKVAAELGYVPNAYAVGMKKGAFNCIAVLHSNLAGRSYLPEKLVYEIHHNLEEEDKHLLLAYIPDQRLNNMELPKILRSLMADGLIVNDYQYLPQKVKDALSYTTMPTVWMNYKMDYNAVYPDSFAAAKKATEYLISLGHKRITYCNVFYDDRLPNAHFSVADRREGYKAAMKEASLDILDISPDYKIDDKIEKQIDFFYSILKSPDRPTAMLFYWSTSIPPLFIATSRLKLNVPDDLSVITFAGESHYRAGLFASSMLEPETDMGREIVAMLNKKLTNKRQPVPSKRLNFHFVDMFTCAKLK